jgi:tetratricopeptide (TPR) repeat protein
MDRFSAHLDRGWDLAMRGETTGALVAARQALELDRDSPEAHNLMGYALALDGDSDEALECYRRAIDLDEWYLEPILNAAELLAHPEADPEEALRLCRRTAEMELGPEEQADALLIEIDALMSLRRDEEARECLERFRSLEQIPAHYLVAASRLSFEIGDLEQARAAADRAIDLDDALADAWHTRGVIERELGRRLAAVRDFLQALERDTRAAEPGTAPEAEAVERAVRAALAELPDPVRSALDGARITVVEQPTAGQVRSEIDPRQVVLAEDISPDLRAFRLLQVFSRNLARVAPPGRWAEELVHLISAEVGFDEGDDGAAGPVAG